MENNIITFGKTYHFEEREISTLDLSALDNLTAKDYCELSTMFSTKHYITPKPEADPTFCFYVAAKASKLPMEFFNNLSIKDTIKVRDRIFTFFQKED